MEVSIQLQSVSQASVSRRPHSVFDSNCEEFGVWLDQIGMARLRADGAHHSQLSQVVDARREASPGQQRSVASVDNDVLARSLYGHCSPLPHVMQDSVSKPVREGMNRTGVEQDQCGSLLEQRQACYDSLELARERASHLISLVELQQDQWLQTQAFPTNSIRRTESSTFSS